MTYSQYLQQFVGEKGQLNYTNFKFTIHIGEYEHKNKDTILNVGDDFIITEGGNYNHKHCTICIPLASFFFEIQKG